MPLNFIVIPTRIAGIRFAVMFSASAPHGAGAPALPAVTTKDALNSTTLGVRALPLIAVILLLASPPAHAYLDPGTGSMLLYALVGMATTAWFSLRSLYYHLKHALLGRAFAQAAQEPEADLVFFSEGRHYWNTFAPIIAALDAQGVKCAYLTADPEDPGLSYRSGNVSSRYLGGDYRSTAYMNHIIAKLVVLTTPQLDVLTLRRSKRVKHYAHIVHAPADILLYKKYSCDYFDSVLCSGPHQIESLRLLERKRELPPKQLLETGCVYYDVMRRKLKDISVERDAVTTVLVAPTWGRNGCLTRYGGRIVAPLLDAGCRVILRPHPQMYKSQMDLVQSIAEAFAGRPNFEIDRAPSGERAMARSHLMLSDISGIIFDYAFLFERPVLVIDSPVERGGFEAEDVDAEIWEIAIRDRIGRIVSESDLERLGDIVGEVLGAKPAEEIKAIRDASCYHFGHAGDVAARQLLDILRAL